MQRNPFRRSGGLVSRLLFVNLLSLPVFTSTASPSAMGMYDDVSLTTVEMIENNGYVAEVHTVTTEDGYILEMHRIPRSKSGQKPTRNHPVIIHHGTLGSSADWVLGGANISLPMQLADDGYDVWMTNCRGNTYSRKHISMTYKQRAFWDFSFHEIGKYDVPTAIDYILMKTDSEQLHYIGYSMGTCVFYIMASERPEYQAKIRSQISLAPVAYLSNTRSSLKYFAPLAKMLNAILQRTSKGMLMPQSKMQKFFAETFCTKGLAQKLICEKCIIFSVCGTDPHHFDSNLIPLIMGHFPAGTSAKLTTHFAQFILKDSFRQYDYGPSKNMLHYNSTCPPSYDLSSIQVPITLIYGENDILADEKDVMKLKAQLPKLVDAFPVDSPYCNHVDFLWSLDVTKQVNDPIRESLGKTDGLDWEYTGPNPKMTPPQTMTAVGNELCNVSAVARPSNSLSFESSMDYVLNNLDALIANTMPQLVDKNDVAAFERERELQKTLFGDLIKYAKSSGKNYGRFRDHFTNEISDWTAGASDGMAGARDAVETQAKLASELINDKMALAGKSVVNGMNSAESSMNQGMAVAESFVFDSTSKAENFVSDSVNRAKQSVVGGIAKAENFVNYGVNKVEQSVVGGIAKTENFVNYGVNKAENFVSDSVNRAKQSVVGGIAEAGNFVNYGLNKVEQSVVGGIAKTENFVNNGVNKAEQSVAGGIAKAGNFVNYGVNKADSAVGSAFNTTFKALSRAFWFLK